MTETERAPLILPQGQGEVILLANGHYLTWKATAQTTQGVFDYFEDIALPGAGIPPHIHLQNEETFWILEGRFEFTLGAQTLHIEAGGFVMIPRGTPHAWKNVGTQAGRLLTMFTPGGMKGYFEELQPVLLANPIDGEALKRVSAKYHTQPLLSA